MQNCELSESIENEIVAINLQTHSKFRLRNNERERKLGPIVCSVKKASLNMECLKSVLRQSNPFS